MARQRGIGWVGMFWLAVFALIATVVLVGSLVGIGCGICISKAHAHDNWISRGGLRNGAGEWCCGEGDCGVMISGMVSAGRDGYDLDANFQIGTGAGAITEHIREFVPHSEAQPSPDGAYWRCKRPDGSRRCFFAPPPNM